MGCDRECLEIEDDVCKVMHPQAVGSRAVALPPVLGHLLHTPVCVCLKYTCQAFQHMTHGMLHESPDILRYMHMWTDRLLYLSTCIRPLSSTHANV